MKHTPVLVKEIERLLHIYRNNKVLVEKNINDINFLKDEIGKVGGQEINENWLVDATLGFGGHSVIAQKLGYNVVGIEADEEILEIAKNSLLSEKKPQSQQIKLIHGNFREIDLILKKLELDLTDVVLIDLGVNNYQLTSETRGFSFKNESADFDMRLDKSGQNIKASDLVNNLRKDQLVEMFSQVLSGGEAIKLAQKIVNKRDEKKFETVGDFLKLFGKPTGKIHPATKAFLSLRMAVNSEMQNLKEVLPKAFSVLKKDGLLVVISFHSTEDRIVKNFFKEKSNDCVFTKKPIIPTKMEIDKNPPSRSAKLRILIKK